MSYKSVLAHVQPYSGEARLELAANLARRFDATLIGLGAQGIPPGLMNDPWGGLAAPVLAEVMKQLEADLLAAERRFGEAAEGLEATWRVGRGAPTGYLASCAAMADLVVISLPDEVDVGGLRAVAAGEAIIACGRPVLFAPEARDRLLAEHVVVAWKNTREARRAVADALPILKLARAVTVLVVSPLSAREGEMALAEDVAANLRRHSVKVTTAWESDADRRTGEIILAHAANEAADLIVAGGYGHSRLGEWVFGGVTRRLLRQDACCVLFSH